MLHKCFGNGFLTNYKIFKGILFIHVTLLLSTFDIISWISFLVEGDIKMTLHISQIMMKKFKGLFNISLDVRCNKTKSFIKTASNIYWICKDLTAIKKIVFGDSDSFIFREFIDLITFHVFFISLIIFLKLL